MTTFQQFLDMTIEERCRVKFAPLNDELYGGKGYLISDRAWALNDMIDFNEWAIANGCVWDGPVCVFPDDETFVMAKLIYGS